MEWYHHNKYCTKVHEAFFLDLSLSNSLSLQVLGTSVNVVGVAKNRGCGVVW